MTERCVNTRILIRLQNGRCALRSLIAVPVTLECWMTISSSIIAIDRDPTKIQPQSLPDKTQFRLIGGLSRTHNRG